MNHVTIRERFFICLAFLCSTLVLQATGNLQLLSARSPSINMPASANGDSDLPIISADGRYVLFASSANNLVTNQDSGPVSGLLPHMLNVFVRDRANGTTRLVSTSLSGAGGNGDSFPAAISTNGQFVLFESAASDLVAGDTNNATDVFLRDLANSTTILVSVSTNGAAGKGSSRSSTMTPDANHIAFASTANDLVDTDTNGIADVFVRDRLAGTTKLASVGAISTGSFTLPAASENPDITPDGHFVAFFSTATNLVPGGNTAGHVYVRDLTGNATTWASTSAQAVFQSVFGTTNAISCNHRISSDGNYVAFEAGTNAPSGAYAQGIILRYHMLDGTTDIVSTNANVPLLRFEDIGTLDMTPDGRFIAFVGNTNGGFGSATCIQLWDAQSATTTLISQNLNGGVMAGDSCNWPKMDSSGRLIAFLASAANLTTNSAANGYNFYVRDAQTGSTVLLSIDTNGLGSAANPWTPPTLSGDGRFVAFTGSDGSLVIGDCNQATDIFVRDVISKQTEQISVRSPALPYAPASGPIGASTIATSSNGLFVAFTSETESPASNDTNKFRDVFVHDVLNSTNILVSVNTNGVAASGISTEPAISGDGRYVAFTSSANDLITGDTNNALDVFVRDLQTGSTTLVSRNSTGNGLGNGDSFAPDISSDGRYVLFKSSAQNLTAGTFNGIFENLFLRDRQLGTNYALSIGNGVYAAAMTPNGGRAAFTADFNASGVKLYVWDTSSARRIYTNNIPGSLQSVAISSNGQLIAYLETQLKALNLLSNSITVISSGTFPRTHRGIQFSGDGRFLVYSTTAANSSTDTNTTADVYLYDFQSGTNALISRNSNSTMAANGASDWPEISPDGRFIAYRTFAADSVGTDLNEVPDLILYDRLNETRACFSQNFAGNWTGNNRSLNPVFSGDSRSLVFASWASDLLHQDFNNGGDVFAFTLTGETSTNSAPQLSVQLLQPGGDGLTPMIIWSAVPGRFYQVQFKNNLSDPVWQNLPFDVTILGNSGYAYDLAPAAGKRFYRVVVSN